MTITRLCNMPIYDEETGIHRSKNCNILYFYCPRCNMIHSIERKDVVYFDCGDEQYLCCYESVQDIDIIEGIDLKATF